MKNLSIISILLILLTFIGCSENKENEIELKSFNDVKVGDVFRYSLFLGQSDLINSSEYTNDFLNIEVVEKLPNGFTVKEWIDDTSNMFTSSDEYYFRDKSAIPHYNWIIEDDKITIEAISNEFYYSHLFLYGIPRQEFSLSELNGEETDLTSWKTAHGFIESDKEFFTKDFELLGVEYPKLNIAVRNEQMTFDDLGKTYVYNKESGFVRVVSYSPFPGEGIGWDRIN